MVDAPAQPGGPRRDDAAGLTLRLWIDVGDDAPRFDRDAQRLHAVTLSDADNCSGNERVQVEVPVGIDVIERQPRGAVGIELRGDFHSHLPPERRTKGNLRPIDGKIIAQPSAVADKSRNICRIDRRLAIDQNDVQPDAQVRQAPRSLDCVGCGRAADHQARSAEYAAAVRFLDGGVNRLAQPEIVRRDDQAIQCASSRGSTLPSTLP